MPVQERTASRCGVSRCASALRAFRFTRLPRLLLYYVYRACMPRDASQDSARCARAIRALCHVCLMITSRFASGCRLSLMRRAVEMRRRRHDESWVCYVQLLMINMRRAMSAYLCQRSAMKDAAYSCATHISALLLNMPADDDAAARFRLFIAMPIRLIRRATTTLRRRLPPRRLFSILICRRIREAAYMPLSLIHDTPLLPAADAAAAFDDSADIRAIAPRRCCRHFASAAMICRRCNAII